MSLFGLSVAKVLPAVAVVGLLSVGASAFAASNTFATANNAAGQSSQTVSGYQISKPAYTIDTTVAGGTITKAEFTATGAQAVTQAALKLKTSDTGYHTCVAGSPTGTAPSVVTPITCSGLTEAISAVNAFDAVLVQ